MFAAVVAVDELPTKVPKKFVAVAAVADKLPENTSVVSTLVPGLNCNVLSELTATPEAVAFTGENNK